MTFLKRLCTSLNLKVTNNHALRMSLNSNVLIPLGISVADRAAMLGHSIETNLKFYSFAQKGYLGTVRDLLDNNSVRLPEGPPSAYGTSGVLGGFCEESVVREPQGTLRRSLILHRKKARDPRNLKLSNTFQECGGWDLNPHDCNSH